MKDLIYYAHPMSWYGTTGEADDVAALKAQGYTVMNPNDGEGHFEGLVQREKLLAKPDIMRIFREALRSCDGLAYRPLTHGPGMITAGVAVEIMEAIVRGLPVFRLSGGCAGQVCSPVYLTEGLPDWNAVLTIGVTQKLIKLGIL
jgi:hypothetical protein